MTETSVVDRLLDKLQTSEKYLRSELSREAKVLGNDLRILSTRLMSGHRPSELGELQSRGTIFDCRCARLSEIMDSIDELKLLRTEDRATCNWPDGPACDDPDCITCTVPF